MSYLQSWCLRVRVYQTAATVTFHRVFRQIRKDETFISEKLVDGNSKSGGRDQEVRRGKGGRKVGNGENEEGRKKREGGRDINMEKVT